MLPSLSVVVVILGVEKNNDEAKAYFHSGNRHNGARYIILTEARLEQLEHDTPTVYARQGHTISQIRNTGRNVSLKTGKGQKPMKIKLVYCHNSF